MIECYICDHWIDPASVWFQILVHEPSDGDRFMTTYGALCSLTCLTDYVAKVHALEIDR